MFAFDPQSKPNFLQLLLVKHISLLGRSFLVVSRLLLL